MRAAGLMESLERDGFSRLRWIVARELGISPLSLRFYLPGRRRLLYLACNLALDKGLGAETQAESGGNPGFDRERFRELAGRV